MFKEARNGVNLSLDKASRKIPCGRRNLARYETGEVVPSPDVVLRMSKVYKCPEMTHIYCREHCAIGREYAYDYLDAVNSDPISVIAKLAGEMDEVHGILNNLFALTVNKNKREDFSDEEWELFTEYVLELLDVEHAVEMLKISLGHWCDVAGLVEEHNQKCIRQGYKRTKKEAALAMAAT